MTAYHARSVLVVGATLAGASAALAAVRSGARTRLLVDGAVETADVPPIPEDPSSLAQQAIERFGLAPPEDVQIFRFRARRVRRWLDELGIANDEAWARNLRQAVLERCDREGVAVDHGSIAVRLIAGRSGVSGAVLVDGIECAVHEADTTVLAGGGAAFLWNDHAPADPPAGLALALRAGLPVGELQHVTWREDTDGSAGALPLRFLDGLRGDGRGRFGVRGVAACGEALASPFHGAPELRFVEDAVRGLEVGAFQAEPAGKEQPELVPAVDDPMPPGFTGVKLSRLRGLLASRAGPDASEADLERAYAELLSLRGEFADYARARLGTDVHLLHQAADVALAHVASRLGRSDGA